VSYTNAAQWWCPNCHIERTGDDLMKACACIVIPHRQERQRILRAERLSERIYDAAEARRKAKALGAIIS
jgi:hypothetical protein